MDDLAEIDRKLDAILERLASPPQRWLTVRSAAVYSDLSEDSIRRLIESDKLSVYRPVRGRMLIDRLELDQVILGSTTRPRKGRGMTRQPHSQN
ncbi:MAG TPA: hypothetical protein VMY37_17630 [Thermoguttaceae bacterium]|nr:hypothetical protein [Thermoguttaceae bacterium]